MKYRPFEKQLEFHNSLARYRLYGGARGGGKSHAVRMEALRQMVTQRGLNGLLLRRTYAEAQATLLYPLLRTLPKGSYNYNEARRELRINGGVLTFGYCQSEQDLLRYQGVEYDFIGIDELTHWQEHHFEFLLGSLRSAKAWRPNFFASANPGGVGHAWVKRRWIDRELKAGERPEDYAFFAARLENNPVLQGDADYVRALEGLPENLRKAWRDGDWDIFAGQFFAEWRREKHVVPPCTPPADWQKFVALDYGYAAPSAALWVAVSPAGETLVYRELYEKNLTYPELGEKILALTPPEERIMYCVADPAIWARNPLAGGESGAELLERLGLPMRRGDNTRALGWLKVRELLREEPGLGRPLLRVTESCRNLIRTLPALVYDAVNADDCDTSGDDHAPDALRYGVMSRSLMWSDDVLGGADLEKYPGLTEEYLRVERAEASEKRVERDFWND